MHATAIISAAAKIIRLTFICFLPFSCRFLFFSVSAVIFFYLFRVLLLPFSDPCPMFLGVPLFAVIYSLLRDFTEYREKKHTAEAALAGLDVQLACAPVSAFAEFEVGESEKCCL